MSRERNDRPLAEFTSLAIAGGGMIASTAAFASDHSDRSVLVFAIGVVLLAAGLVRSFGHLGQKRRAAYVWRGVGRSPLSREVLFASLLLASSALTLAWPDARPVDAFIRPGTAILGALFLWSIGSVYHLGGQHTWQGASRWIPVTTGFAFGAMVLAAIDLPSTPPGVVWWLVGIDTAVFLVRGYELSEAHSALKTDAGAAWVLRPFTRTLLRLMLFDAAPLALLAVGPGPAIWIAAAVGLWIDRTSFYALASQHTTEAEIARVESVLADLARDKQ